MVNSFEGEMGVKSTIKGKKFEEGEGIAIVSCLRGDEIDDWEILGKK